MNLCHLWIDIGNFFCCLKAFSIQGVDDKLGQFLDQDIEASANHRNVLRHSLKSCPSLVSPNVNKPSIFTKMCRQSTKLVSSPKSFARRKKSTTRFLWFLKVHRSLVYTFETYIPKFPIARPRFQIPNSYSQNKFL